MMLMQDRIPDFVPSPLIGANLEELGTRFPDMSEIYDKKLQQIIKKTAADQRHSIGTGRLYPAYRTEL